MTNWTDRALCASIGSDLWFPEKGESARNAIAICSRCPVKQQCLDEWRSLPSTQRRYGIWGGLTVVERETDDNTC